MRIDAHHHVWQMDRYDYAWMGPELEVLHRDYGPDDLEPNLRHHRIEHTVLVQTISSVEETRWFLELAGAYPFIAGVVGWVDLTDPEVGQTIEELRAGAKLVGIRHQVHDEPDARWLLRAEVLRGLEEVSNHGLAYDLLIRPAHLAVSLAVARRVPDLRLIVDHIAKPAIAQRGWDDWADGIAALAACPNVACKLSGMVTEADWKQWTLEDFGPYIAHVLEQFGPDRVMFGSDWPVCLLAGSYDQVVEMLTSHLESLSSHERRHVFGNTAANWYRIPLSV